MHKSKYSKIMKDSLFSISKDLKKEQFKMIHQDIINYKRPKLMKYYSLKQVNNGTGAGGFKTNQNGLPYEKLTNLENHYNILKEYPHYQLISLQGKMMVSTKKTSLFKYMERNMNHQVVKAHGCKQPDECFIDESQQTIFIIEKKFQQTGGSVCEKIQTSDFKLWQYSRTFPNYKVVYIYCLSNWFRNNCLAELEYLNAKKVPIFWGDDSYYKSKIIDYIVNYSR